MSCIHLQTPYCAVCFPSSKLLPCLVDVAGCFSLVMSTSEWDCSLSSGADLGFKKRGGPIYLMYG